MDCIYVHKNRKIVVLCSRPPENVKLGRFVVLEQRRRRNVQKSVVHVQSCCFAN